MITLKIKKILYGIGLFSGGGLLIWQLIKGYNSLTQQELGSINVGNVSYSVMLSFLAMGFQIIAWSQLMNSTNFQIPFASVIQGYTISFLPRYLPGTVLGYVSRGSWLQMEYQVPMAVSTSISVWEILASVCSNVMLALGYLIFNKYAMSMSILLTLLLLLMPVLGFIIITKILDVINAKQIKVNNHELILKKIMFSSWLKAVILFLLHWGLLGGSLYFLLLGFHATNIRILPVIFAGNVSWLIGFLIFFAPAGLGYRELVLSNILSKELLVPENTAYITGSFFRLVTILGELVWVIIGILFSIKKHCFRQNHENNS